MTRCAGLSPLLAVIIFLLLGLAVAASLGTVLAEHKGDSEGTSAPASQMTDLALYRSLLAQVLAGRDYYAAAIEAQRKGNYPVRPFFTVRLPTLTWLIAALSPLGAQVLMLLLVAATIMAWAGHLVYSFSPRHVRIGGIILLPLGFITAMIEPGIWFTEIWAGVLISLSLAPRRPGRWWPSIAAALAAVLIRELALPYLLAMGILAALTGQRREAIGWGIAIGVFAVAVAAHAHVVLALTLPDDPLSPGWSGHGGWALFMSFCLQMTMLTALPAMLVAVLLPFSFFGWAAWNSPVALRAFVTLSGYTLLIALFARPNNCYWILMVSPILCLGLLFAPLALADLIRSVRRRPKYGMSREETDACHGIPPPLTYGADQRKMES